MRRTNRVVEVEAIGKPATMIIRSRNPAYNLQQTADVDSRLSSITQRINQLGDENAMLRASLKPKLIRDKKLKVEAPDEDSFKMATDKINQNASAIQILMKERERIEDEARFNMKDFVQDKTGRPATVLKPFEPEVFQPITMTPFALQPIPPRPLTEYKPRLRPGFDVNILDDIRYVTVAELAPLAPLAPSDISGLLQRLPPAPGTKPPAPETKPTEPARKKYTGGKKPLTLNEQIDATENFDKLSPNEVMIIAQKLGVTDSAEIDEFTSPSDRANWERKIYHAIYGKTREQQKEEEEKLKKKQQEAEEAKKKAEEAKKKADDDWFATLPPPSSGQAKPYTPPQPTQPPRYEPPIYDGGRWDGF